MLKIEHVVLPSPEQMEFVIEGMRNPKNSWDRSDSEIETVYDEGGWDMDEFVLGENDHFLMKQLSIAGTEHRKYLRMMPVFIRITAPLYWWKEMDTYKVGTVSNSCSTMHKIHAKEFVIEDFSHDKIDQSLKIGDECTHRFTDVLNITLRELNLARKLYLETKDKKYWYVMIQMLSSSYNQTRNVMVNYEVLANIYRQRRGHKLDEWHVICDWIESLPHADLITGGLK